MADECAQFPVSNTHWRRSYRIIPARFPPVSLFEGIAGDPADLDALNELEGLTSNRLREEAGQIHLIRPEDRRFGSGWSPVMAALCYPRESRFTDGTFGVYYCADREGTAVAESRYHRERFLAESSEPPITIEMRVYIAALRAPLVDLRDTLNAAPYLHANDWSKSQRLGAQARTQDHYGLVYPSVRDRESGQCAAVLRPPALGPTYQGKHFAYRWDGQRITTVLEIRETRY